MSGIGRLSGGPGSALLRSKGATVVIGAVVVASVAAAPARAAAATAFVRVNQVGYAADSQAKRAYLMSGVAETGATFSIRNSSGDPVYSAPIGANLGKWSSSYPHVYALDFNKVITAGTYTI